MLRSIYDFIYSKLASGVPPVHNIRKRPFDENDEEPFEHIVKYQKLDSKSSKMSKEFEIITLKSGEKSKENIRANLNKYDEDDECCVVAEISSRWGADSILTGRRGIKPNASSTPVTSQSTEEKKRQPLLPTQPTKADENDVEIVKHVRNVPIKVHNDFISANVPGVFKASERIFRPFRSGTNKIVKPKASLSSSFVRRGARMQNETFRLAEKAKYWAYLQFQTKSASFLNNFKLKEVGLRKAIKPSIPVIDLEKEQVNVNHEKEIVPVTKSTSHLDSQDDDIVVLEEHKCAQVLNKTKHVNSLEDLLRTYPVTDENFIQNIFKEHSRSIEEKKKSANIEETKLKLCQEKRKYLEDSLEQRMREFMKVTDPILEEIEDSEEPYELPDLTEEHEKMITKAFRSSNLNEVLTRKFNMEIRRKDILTLEGLHWLNDEVINFYMNLLIERGKEDTMPNVYAFNTFFSPNICQRGFQSVKRWTKKVDIFAQDLIVVPVHLGMHWCLAIIDFRDKTIRYYDSMGSPNNNLLKALKKYLEDESLDKKKTTYDTSDWNCENMQDIPQQMNGSDCGIFSCTFAEHVTRNAPLAFTQELMPYFRKKMVVEILDGKLIT